MGASGLDDASEVLGWYASCIIMVHRKEKFYDLHETHAFNSRLFD